MHTTYLDTGSQLGDTRERRRSANHLLVVMRGDTYLLYANDHLLDVANQQYDDPKLTQGLVGVFVADPAVTGSFTNFAVYANAARDLGLLGLRLRDGVALTRCAWPMPRRDVARAAARSRSPGRSRARGTP